MSSTTCTSLPQLEKVHTIAGTTQRSRAQVHPPTTPCAVGALLQYSARELTSCVFHRERGRRLSGVERSGVSDNAATDGGGGGVRAQTTLAEASVGGGSVTGAASAVGETRRACTTM